MHRVLHLPDFGFLAVTGKDAVKFMQGYTTCDLDDLMPGNAGIGAVCNIQGRMVTSFRVISIDDGLLLRMDRGLIAATVAFLAKYIVFSKASLRDLSDEMHCFGVFGPMPEVQAGPNSRATLDSVHLIRAGSGDRFEAWSASADFSLTDATAADPMAWARAEVDDGLVWISTETTNEFIPQMAGYHEIGGVDFDKGCYLGQEIVARMQYRGALNRKLYRGHADTISAVGDALATGEGKSVGTVVAVAGNDFLAVVQAKDDQVPACFVHSTPVTLARVNR